MAKAKPPAKPARKAASRKKRPAAKTAPELLADLQTAAQGLAMQAAGQPLSTRKAAALRRVGKLFGAGIAAGAYRALPKRLWVKWSGRAHQQIAEQADRHNLPLAGATIDLEELAPALHELLALREAAAGKQKRSGRALELIRREELLLKRMERMARQRVLLERQSVHDTFQLVAEILRKSAAAILDQFGADAHAIVDEALEEAVRLVNSLSADATQPND